MTYEVDPPALTMPRRIARLLRSIATKLEG